LGLGRLAQWRALDRALARSGPFDVIHGIWADPAGLLASVAGWRRGIPSIITCDSGEFVAHPDVGYGLQRTVRGRVLVRAVTLLASRLQVASSHAKTLAARLGIATTLIPLGIRVPRDSITVDRPTGPPWRLLQVASLNRVKEQLRLIEALALLDDSLDVRLDLVGEDTLGGALQAAAAARGVAGRITFHGFLPQDAIAPLRARAHLYVQTSRHEGAGVSVLEAAAAGLPVLGTRVGYLADWAPTAGEAIDDASPPSFARAIARLLADDQRRVDIASRALAIVRAHDVNWTVDAVLELYEEAGATRG
jgi:glycosyltransferase involved in cell wall biosynthesis